MNRHNKHNITVYDIVIKQFAQGKVSEGIANRIIETTNYKLGTVYPLLKKREA